MKTCSRCGISFPLTSEYFHIEKRAKDGLRAKCKKCRKGDSRKYYLNNRDRIRQRTRQYNLDNPTIVKAQQRRYREANPEKVALNSANWQKANPEKFKRIQDKYKAANKHIARRRAKRYREIPKYRLSHSISNGIWCSLNRDKNNRHWESLVGYTISDLMTHLESQFTKGMTWENYGDWHIDHIRPISDFSFTTPDDPDFKVCWSLWNLQPMWARENIIKGNDCKEPPLPLLARDTKTEEVLNMVTSFKK